MVHFRLLGGSRAWGLICQKMVNWSPQSTSISKVFFAKGFHSGFSCLSLFIPFESTWGFVGHMAPMACTFIKYISNAYTLKYSCFDTLSRWRCSGSSGSSGFRDDVVPFRPCCGTGWITISGTWRQGPRLKRPCICQSTPRQLMDQCLDALMETGSWDRRTLRRTIFDWRPRRADDSMDLQKGGLSVCVFNVFCAIEVVMIGSGELYDCRLLFFRTDRFGAPINCKSHVFVVREMWESVSWKKLVSLEILR